MGTVRLPDTILARLQETGRLPRTPSEASGPGRARPRARQEEDWPGSLAAQCHVYGLPDPVREHRFHGLRRWRFDLAWPGYMLACEVDGGAWVGGRHTSGAGFEADCEKHSEAVALGWRVLRVTPRHVQDGRALGWVERALGGGS